MREFPTPSFLASSLENSFNLKEHLQEFLNCDSQTLESNLETKQKEIIELGHKDFNWEEVSTFYREKVGELYLFELGAWHLSSYDYINDTLRLIADFAKGRVLDFGGGIGTHALGAALCPQVEQVVYCDINPINRDFVQYRAEQLGLSQKISCYVELPALETFDTILCFDVLEHLPDPSQQLLQFYQALTDEGKIILNWYFFKGFDREFPFHLDDPKTVDEFFHTLQSNFLEVFTPYFITSRCYKKQHQNEIAIAKS
ncbi:class I SAM-dependent methyltransferase [Oscillatoria sp. FACHB-1406]|uniref:class I SAM-dependent methyltransferase n=1 Tax=Oscillatoria sp. FACHB-1406 TaxID=2692846 RepID=UPI0016820F0D|nr:class I SAM-dependent methyltransferase [Oscillatoria sp. FACHB-1406]MBD2579998.1 class I SAM-dependent methyltransferase [Oscillatoria sp. FACHB-1406]